MSSIPDSVHPAPNQLVVYSDQPKAEEDDISLVALATAILRYRHWIFAAALLFAVLAGILTVIKPRTYTTSAAFIPQSRGATSAFATAAGLVGLLPAGGDQSQAPQF